MKIKDIICSIIFLVSSILVLSCSTQPNTPPTVVLDGAKYENGFFYANGWAADEEEGSPVRGVKVFVDNKVVGNAKLGIDRLDVATVMKSPKWDKSGWKIYVKILLDKGSHTSYAVAVNRRNAKARLNNEIRFDME